MGELHLVALTSSFHHQYSIQSFYFIAALWLLLSVTFTIKMIKYDEIDRQDE
jgi:hypothetical protein